MKKKKWRDIRSAVTMMCVMAAMLSTATYAWFSLTSSPTVTGLEMTAASSDGLKIAKTDTGDWVDAIDMDLVDDNSFVLKPVSVIASDKTANFYTPIYTGNTVTDLATPPLALKTGEDASDLEGWVATTKFFLKSEADSAETINVGIITVDQKSVPADTELGVTATNQATVPGSFLKLKSAKADTVQQMAIKSMRVGFVVGNSTEMIIWEPNAGTTVAADSTFAENKISQDASSGKPAATPNVSSSYDNGKILTGGDTNGFVSDSLFTIQGGQAVPVRMYIWIEGQDDECVDQIIEDVIQAQVQFTVVE